jgi:F-type H+-transporting ATPase subunit b
MIFLGFAESSIQLVPDGTLLLHIAIILLMIYVLNATMFKPINRILEEREKRTKGRSGEAHEILSRVEEGLSRYERTLREARAEGYRLMEQERATAMADRQARLNSVRAEIEALLGEQKEAIRQQTEEARTVLQKESRRLAAEIGAHVLHRQLSDEAVSSIA